jgi:hypothetical protein
MLKFPKNLLIPLFFYLFAFIFDATITSFGITNKLGSEGDPVTLWFWGIFGYDSLLLKIIYIVLIFSVSYLIYHKISKFIAVLIPYCLGVGHILGFSTWIFHLNNEFNLSIINRLHAFLVPYGLFIISPIIGFFISYIHIKRIKS